MTKQEKKEQKIMEELLNKIFDKLADNHFDGFGIFDFADLDYGYIYNAKKEIVLIKGNTEYVLTLTKRPYEE